MAADDIARTISREWRCGIAEHHEQQDVLDIVGGAGDPRRHRHEAVRCDAAALAQRAIQAAEQEGVCDRKQEIEDPDRSPDGRDRPGPPQVDDLLEHSGRHRQLQIDDVRSAGRRVRHGAEAGDERQVDRERRDQRDVAFHLAGQSHAAPRTPLASPCLARTSLVSTRSEKTCWPQSAGTRSYRRVMFERPPPSTITSGSATLMIDGDRARKAAFVPIETGQRARIATLGAGRDVSGRKILAAKRDVIASQCRSGQKRLDASRSPAVTRRPGTLIVFGSGQRVVTPLAGDRIGADHDAAVDDEAAAGTGADDHAEDNGGAGRGAIGCFGQREAVRIVGKANRARQRLREVIGQAASIQPGGVGVLD
jgi:hypothetical protein